MEAVSTDVPDETTRAAVLRLAERIEHEDGAPPLSDQSLTQLGSPGVAHFTVLRNGEVLGYAQRDGESAEIVAIRESVATLVDALAAGELAVNAAAFATHPEQGRWTQADLQARIDEPWFDAAGFLIAEGNDGSLLGYHWTKVHPDGAGEVYVLGVAPTAQTLGLGNALLVRGLRHLAGRGCTEVLLYVDGDNPAAMRLYERAGFHEHDLDVQWRRRRH
jgi:ribosomal protein S18 acetylase RimI-like enzyme